MSTWMNESVAPNHNGNIFPHMNDPSLSGAMMDPSAAFMANAGQFNPAQFQNPQQPMNPPMPNGAMRNASPTYQNPVYQTNPIIPSKRPRPHEDVMASSPRQNPGMLPPPRSETPQQGAFPGFQPTPQQNPGQPQYPHLQPNGSANATPSPMMGNQQLRPGSVPQRVSTASPHPFSPSTQQFAPQGSPVPSDHGTPQPNPYMQNMAPGFNPNMGAMPTPTRPSQSPNPMAGGMQMMPQQMGQPMGQQMPQMPPMGIGQGMSPQQMAHMQQQISQMSNPMFHPQMQQARTAAEQQKLYQMQLQRQMQQQGNVQQMHGMANMQMPPQMHPQMHPQNMQAGRGMMAKQPVQGPNGHQMQQPGMRPQARPMPRPDPESFMKNLTAFMNAKGLPLDVSPTLADRPVNLLLLFQQVQSRGGFKAVTAANMWPHVSSQIGFHPVQMPAAPQMLRAIYDRNLLKFEEALMAQNQRKMMQQQQPHLQGQPQPQVQQQQAQQPPVMQGQPIPSNQIPATPTKQMGRGQPQMMPQGQSPMPRAGPHPPTPKAMQPGQQPAVNGFSGPHGPQPGQANMPAAHVRNNLSRNIDPASGGPTGEFQMPSPAPGKPGAMSFPGHGPTSVPVPGTTVGQPFPRPVHDDEYSPCSRQQSTYGGVNLESANKLGIELETMKPDVPPVDELGFIDIQALTRSIQSGIHGEVRLSLDTLAAVSNSPMRHHFLQLQYCDDLIDVLLDCAEEQVELLAEHTVQVSDEILLTPYEDVVRACRLEQLMVRDVSAFGSQEYELDRAVDRLICITTILRNLSFPGEENPNHPILANEEVTKFLCVVIRYIGTRTMLLRTNANTLDFMKDVVVLLSNLSVLLEIPGREQAMCLLQFLLAFAPTPGPSLPDGYMYFVSYDPALHPYLPHAIDSLAKLLARDEPNRSHYKVIFSADADGPNPYDLLTRAFGLAISPIPEQPRDGRPPHLPPLVEARKPFVMQGLLAAEILASIAPGYEAGIVKTWLSCHNGLSQRIYRLIQLVASQFDNPPRGPGGRGQPRSDDSLLCLVVLGVTLLRRLMEKSRDPSNPTSIPPSALPTSDSVLSAMMMTSPEWTKEGVLQQLLSFLTLDT